ncbi:STAS domain-containing protein [Streptomyces sp. NPDC048111]|uniref:STAS domain-containing protein n=1 Tax=Streptomyces sp. NPDC048111 TaxID=3365500 RepID=UPI0037216628
MSEGQTTSAEHAGWADQLSVAITTVSDGIRVVALDGEIDHQSGEALGAALTAPDAACPRVVVDLSRVTFMDSSGINLFISAHLALSGAGGWLRLAAGGEAVMRTIGIVGIDTVIACFPTVGEALA